MNTMPATRKVPFFSRPVVPVVLWFAAALIIPVVQYAKGSYNNYSIFKGAFYHLIRQQPLYATYPEYWDTNHYGPLFGILIAPFALLPDLPGMVLWSLFNTWVLYKAVQILPLEQRQKTGIFWIGFVELTTAHHSLQINPALTGWIILTFVFLHRRKLFWAAAFPLIGFFIKLYGIVAFALGAFEKKKGRLALYAGIWTLLFIVAPMVISSPAFVLQSYSDWMQSLLAKNDQNVLTDPLENMQNISAMGLVSRILSWPDFPVLAILVPAAVLMLAPLFRFQQHNSKNFQLYYLSALLLSIVLFSTGSESPTYIIAVMGAALFFVLQPRPLGKWTIALFCLMMLLTCLSPTDIFPRSVRKEIIQPYALKALPCLLIWGTVMYHLLTRKFYEPDATK